MNDALVPANRSLSVCAPSARLFPEWPKDKSFVFGQADLVINTVTISSKVKPEAYPWLEQASREVNEVWNFCNETSHKAWRNYVGVRKWMSSFDVMPLVAGCADNFDKIGIDVAQSVVVEHAHKRNQTHRAKLNWRKSGGSRKSLGWVPFKAVNLRFSLHDKNGKKVVLKNDPQPVVPSWPKKVEGGKQRRVQNSSG